MLVRRHLVAIAGRQHDAFDTHVHHFVEEPAHAVRIGAVEEGGVGGHAESALLGRLDRSNGLAETRRFGRVYVPGETKSLLAAAFTTTLYRH